jgi:predicted dehydrogenase
MKAINVALVGLGFGGCFANIYRDHPQVGSVGLYDPDAELLRRMAENCGVAKTYGSFEEILRDETLDAVHLVTPIPLHAEQTVQVLEAGKHRACTVPMATSLEDIARITAAARGSGKNHMMMETTLYTYQFFYVTQLLQSGQLGRIQFLRGSHYQDMANRPDYWMGLPPMYYGTHAIGPMVALSGSRIERVTCFGSGTMEPWLREQYGNPYPIESALFSFANGLKGEATRSLFETAREYQEGLFVYGSEGTFEWGFRDGDAPSFTSITPAPAGERGGRTGTKTVELPNYYQSLPEPIQPYTVGGNFDPLNPQESLKKARAAGTMVRARTWCMNSFRVSWKTASPGSMRRWAATSPPRAFARTPRPCAAAK